ncbi:MAG: molybdenum cofactor guanylyltransferase [Euryarchaeota archaeon]|nr:molybdenum cofactor guanylyltransferase [Euryarchaeota archaeon]
MSEDTAAGRHQTDADTGRAGIVLAGGRSNRFPTVDKALAPLDGTPLLWHAVDSVAPTADELIVNCRRDQREAFAEVLSEFPIRFAIDRVPDRGPLVGLRTALAESTATYAAVLPCDMPSIPAAFLDFLFTRARNRTGAVARFEGRLQPFPAVVHVRAAAAACREAETTGADRLDAFISAVDPHTVPERVVRAHVDPAAFRNINTHDDLAAARDS